MCFREVLSKTNHGTIYISPCGEYYKIVFNNIIFIHDQKAFTDFYANVENCHKTVKDETIRDNRDIVFSTLMKTMILCFSVDEICELHYLLQSALIDSHAYA